MFIYRWAGIWIYTEHQFRYDDDDDDELTFNDASTHGVILRLEGYTAL